MYCKITFATKLLSSLFIALFSAVAFAQNSPPVADAGSDFSILEFQIGSLNGTLSSDPDSGDLLSFSWAQIAGTPSTILNQDQAEPIFLAPSVEPGGDIIVVELTVSDPSGAFSTDTVEITVRDSSQNSAPIADAVAPDVATEGATVQLDASGSIDPDGDFLFFTWQQTTGTPVVIDNIGAAQTTFVAPSNGVEDIAFEILVSDTLLTDTATVTISIGPENLPPVASAGADQEVEEGAEVSLDGETGSSDPEGETLSYIWSQLSGAPVTLDLANPAQPTFTAPAAPDTLTFELLVSDGVLSTTAQTTVTVVPGGAAPNCDNARPNKRMMKMSSKRKLQNVKIKGITLGDVDGDGVDDSSDDDPVLLVTIDSITQDEPTAGLDDRDASPDAVLSVKEGQADDGTIIRKNRVMLRQERDENGNGRVYEISFTAVNQISNLSCQGSVQVCVYKKDGKEKLCEDDGQFFDSYVE